MFILSASDEKLEIVLGGAHTANALEWSVTYAEYVLNTEEPILRTLTGVTNGATPVDMLTAPDEQAIRSKHIMEITVYNADTVTQDVFVQIDTGGTDTRLWKEPALAVGATLMYVDSKGWF